MKETAYLFQSALISAWWVGLATHHSFFQAFQFEGIPDTAFWSFFAPDVVLIAGLSALRAYFKHSIIECVVLGAFGYAALYCVNATILTGSGFLPTGMMLLGLAYNLFLVFSRFSFRNARSQDFKINAMKTLVQIGCVWTVALVAIPFVILDAFDSYHIPELDSWLCISLCFFSIFSLLGLVSAYFMVRDGGGTPLPIDQPNQLVLSGPYRFVRNPMAIAGIGQGIGVAMAFQSVPILVYAMIGALVWHLVVRPVEERDMVQRFGQSYLDYQKRVGCWLPTFNSIR